METHVGLPVGAWGGCYTGDPFAFLFALSRVQRASTALRAASLRSFAVIRAFRAVTIALAYALRSSAGTPFHRGFPPSFAASLSHAYSLRRRLLPTGPV